jgi:hypothetical protein
VKKSNNVALDLIVWTTAGRIRRYQLHFMDMFITQTAEHLTLGRPLVMRDGLDGRSRSPATPSTRSHKATKDLQGSCVVHDVLRVNLGASTGSPRNFCIRDKRQRVKNRDSAVSKLNPAQAASRIGIVEGFLHPFDN